MHPSTFLFWLIVGAITAQFLRKPVPSTTGVPSTTYMPSTTNVPSTTNFSKTTSDIRLPSTTNVPKTTNMPPTPPLIMQKPPSPLPQAVPQFTGAPIYTPKTTKESLDYMHEEVVKLLSKTPFRCRGFPSLCQVHIKVEMNVTYLPVEDRFAICNAATKFVGTLHFYARNSDTLSINTREPLAPTGPVSCRYATTFSIHTYHFIVSKLGRDLPAVV